jgi:hypothetical protein
MTSPHTPQPPTSAGVSTAGLDNLITAHQSELGKPGVLSVRPGYEITDGWLTGRRAIVLGFKRFTSRRHRATPVCTPHDCAVQLRVWPTAM